MPKIERREKEGLSDVTFQLSNFNVTLGQKISNVMTIRLQKERRRRDKLRNIESGGHFPNVLEGGVNR